MTEVKTPKEFFEEVLPNRFKPEKSVGIDVKIQIKITGPNGGDWVVSIKNQKLEIQKGIHPFPTLELKMVEEDYMDLINRKISGEKAFITGKINFKGDIGLALRLREAGFL
ncbi:MAG: SCP2 sterol-binding domain-containing protein [Candidatus Bathyarchaeota archaeon]|nr:SCP2 sterol-binding domain-containing protein [Candidatus Bathyarchaeota archaeon]